MKKLFLALILLFEFSSCVQSQNIKIPEGSKGKPSANEAVATFAEGCFWHSEIVFQSLVGVRDAISGYAGGNEPDPDYDKVSTGATGYAEAVQVFYDPSKISYETLVKAFFASQDPTTLNKQGNDVGPQYRSVAFYRNRKEMEAITNEIKHLTDSKTYKNKIVTEVLPFSKFYPAEEYHQEYVIHHPESSYVKNVTIPDFIEFKQKFKGNFK